MKSIIFLESTVKKRTIKSFLGEKYVIFATGGHLTEISKKGYLNLGIDPWSGKFSPEYEIIKEKEELILFWKKYIEKENIKNIFLATDPDREGEAISKEIVKVLDYPNLKYKRLLFFEINSNSIKKSLEEPTEINNNLVEAQVSRMVLDRIIGFCLSNILRKKMKAFSAGRVQSVVLKLIVDKETEILKKKREYIICVTCLVNGEEIILKHTSGKGEIISFPDFFEAEKILGKLGNELNLIGKEKRDEYIIPNHPITTSSLLSEAKRRLNFSISKTTKIAQKLYEGIKIANKNIWTGLITYPRTDSTRINCNFSKNIYKIIEEKWGKEYCNFSPLWKKKRERINVQGAHESIRPTYLNYHPNDEIIKRSLTREEYQLYSLIFFHTLSSFMMPSKFKNNLFFFNNNNFTFTLSEKENIFPGFLICQSKSILNNINSKKNTVNNISKLVAKKKEIKENLRKKPFRYNEGNIIKKLEELGIGRPSTYNSFCQIILKRKYVFLDEKKNFVPTKLGFLVNKWLQNNFSLLINEKYTASLESELDKISNGNETYFCFINNFWNNFSKQISKFENE